MDDATKWPVLVFAFSIIFIGFGVMAFGGGLKVTGRDPVVAGVADRLIVPVGEFVLIYNRTTGEGHMCSVGYARLSCQPQEMP